MLSKRRANAILPCSPSSRSAGRLPGAEGRAPAQSSRPPHGAHAHAQQLPVEARSPRAVADFEHEVQGAPHRHRSTAAPSRRKMTSSSPTFPPRTVMTFGDGGAALTSRIKMAALRRAVPVLSRALAGPGGAAPGRRWVRALRRSPVRVLPPLKEQAKAQQSPVEHHPPLPAVERDSAGPGLWYEKASPGDRSLG